MGNDYRIAFKAACADLGAISALLGFEAYPGVDALLRSITELLAAHSAGAQEPIYQVRRNGMDKWIDVTHEAYELRNYGQYERRIVYTQPQPMPQTDVARDVEFEITPEIASEWARRQDIEHVIKDFRTQRCAIEDARTLHLAEIERLDRAKGE